MAGVTMSLTPTPGQNVVHGIPNMVPQTGAAGMSVGAGATDPVTGNAVVPITNASGAQNSREPFLSGALLTLFGPGQFWDGESHTYSVPGDWPAAGALLRIPREARVIWQLQQWTPTTPTSPTPAPTPTPTPTLPPGVPPVPPGVTVIYGSYLWIQAINAYWIGSVPPIYHSWYYNNAKGDGGDLGTYQVTPSPTMLMIEPLYEGWTSGTAQWLSYTIGAGNPAYASVLAAATAWAAAGYPSGGNGTTYYISPGTITVHSVWGDAF